VLFGRSRGLFYLLQRVHVLAAPPTVLIILGLQTYSSCRIAVFELHVLLAERQLTVDAVTLELRIKVRSGR